MVRALAGTLKEVGLENYRPEWVKEVLESKNRKQAGANLPAHGLTLARVDYPEEALTFDGSFRPLAPHEK